MNLTRPLRQRGVALPVMLIMLVVMLLGSLYLMRASHNTTMTTANLAYDSALSKAVDLGLVTGSNWLATTAAGVNKILLESDSAANGYIATYNPGSSPSNNDFWVGSVTLVDGPNTIEYVIHRMCSLTGRFDDPGPPPNACVQTTSNKSLTGSGMQVGESLASDAQPVPAPPQIHYVITARIFGPRGGNVVNQAVVMIGA